MSDILRIARKELSVFFGSPVAYIFIGAFLAVCLFVFFWVAAFFARNIADARPLFEWMPVLLIFLCAALTMRLWSEERREGTLETLLTLPVATWRLVMAKFLAALALVAIALALTLPLPLTVSLLGPLDWGPVFGAYLATLLLAAAYLAIGLFVSSRTDNPIVALIGSVVVCAFFYLLGSEALTNLFGNRGAEVLRLLGSGSRFDSITRGVIDLRDLYYYVSIVGTFLALTVYSLERLRWAPDTDRPEGHRRLTLVTVLAAANLLTANLWLNAVDGARVDLTEGRLYTISDATRGYLEQLQEPLLIRGYFSAQTHPLLAPLVPQIRDLLKEYQVAGNGRVRVEFVDPADHPDLEREAGEQFGIRPVAFQTASKYQAGIVNSYFDLVVKYGDQFEHLGFQDLIEVKVRGETDLDVRLRNPEYDITRALKKVLYGYQGGGDLFGGLTAPVRLRAFITDPAKLPAPLPELSTELQTLLTTMQANSNGRFSFTIQDPGADKTLAKEVQDRFGFKPLVMDLLNPTPFYFNFALESGQRAESVPVPESLDKDGLQRAIEAGIKRFAPGVLRTLAVYTPPQAPNEYGLRPQQGSAYSQLEERLHDGFNLAETDLKSGQVPGDADLLLVLGPENLDQKQQFAIDQFLLGGKPVFLAVDPSSQHFKRQGGQSAMFGGAQPNVSSDLPTLLKAYGITYNPQNVAGDLASATQVQTSTGIVRYPVWLTLAQESLNRQAMPVAQLKSALFVESGSLAIEASGRTVTPLIETSASGGDVPALSLQFAQPEEVSRQLVPSGRKTLAAVISGKFTSAFPNGAPSNEPAPAADANKAPTPATPPTTPALRESPGNSTLLVVADTDWLFDDYSVRRFNFLGVQAAEPLNDNLAFASNSLEFLGGSQDLISIRGKGSSMRPFTVVRQMEVDAQRRYQEQLTALEARINDVQQKLTELQGKRNEGNRLVATPEMQKAIDDFQAQQAVMRGERREIRKALREEIERLENGLLVGNLLAPVLLVGAVGFVVHRRRRR